jgi:hypothetical protein
MPAGLRASAAVGRTSGRCCPVELGRIVVGFDAHCSSAFSADVVVLVSARENEEELRPCRCRSATLGAEQAGRLKLSEALLPGHHLEFYTGAETTLTHSKEESPKRVLVLPDLEHAKAAVLSSLKVLKVSDKIGGVP